MWIIEEQNSSGKEKSLEHRALGRVRFGPGPPRLLLPPGCPASLCFPGVINLSCTLCHFYRFPLLQSLVRSPPTECWENAGEQSKAPASSFHSLSCSRRTGICLAIFDTSSPSSESKVLQESISGHQSTAATYTHTHPSRAQRIAGGHRILSSLSWSREKRTVLVVPLVLQVPGITHSHPRTS